ncbi:Mg-protoporphyrin IX methyl transferase [Caballeronia udeis]|uniref:Mg-protoporphyrin IX methyl transferase n=1 Tax=Caballeronia udeis TaxID=1232866 RepID=A0A158IJ84_9BURK|nr:class I SAM-dependent methyltransferase [Caballeronia udeis]SAL56614.1 Mg-protoporphyrin IX methyl transferase [Caballeronia udeis]
MTIADLGARETGGKYNQELSWFVAWRAANGKHFHDIEHPLHCLMKILKTVDELDEEIRKCDAVSSDTELRALFRTFKMKYSKADEDPFSMAYATAQFKLYEEISGQPYRLQNEETKFDLDAVAVRPFPYSTGSTQVVGDQLFAIGSLMRRMKIPSGGRILEFGPGWGNTTIAFAKAGFQVTAVDIEKRFCELLERRAAQAHVSLSVINDDFMWAESVSEPYDAVVFFECFHHCADHMRLLRALQKTLKINGRIYFLGEPITRRFRIAWGLRLDGESLWAVRKHGWLELGFNETYFERALAGAGLRGMKYQSLTTTATVWEIGRIDEFHPRVLDVWISKTLSRLASFASRGRDVLRARKARN